MKRTSLFKRILAVLLCFCMVVSGFPSGLSIVANADGEVNASSINLKDAMHFIIRHWHSQKDESTSLQGDTVVSSGDRYLSIAEGYIVPGDDGQYRFLLVYQSDDSEGHKAGDMIEITDGAFAQGSAYIEKVDANKGAITLNAKPVSEEVEHFSGFSISAGHKAVTHNDNNSITIQYDPYIHLVKGHVFYIKETMEVNSTADDAVFGENGSLTGGDPEIDTAEVYTYKADCEYNGKSHKKNEIAKDSTGKVYGKGDTLPADLEPLVQLTKFYSTKEGLHTDKTAKVTDSDGRTFTLDLEAWYTEGQGTQVGMILDASGSMAFTSETLDAINVLDVLGIKSDGNGGYVYKDGSEITDETLIAFTEKIGALQEPDYLYPQHDALIGYYTFNKGNYPSDNVVDRDWLVNGVAGKANATLVDQSTGELYTVTNWSTEKRVNMNANYGFNLKPDTNGQGSELALKLGEKPSSGNFTVSFTIRQEASNEQPVELAEIMHIGAINTADGLRVYRGAGESSNGLQADSTPAINLDNVFDYSSVKTNTVTFVFSEGENGETEITAYVNGEQNQDGSTYAGTVTLSDCDIIFNALGDSYDGGALYVDNIFVYDTALTAGEVKQLYTEMGKGTDIDAKETNESLDWENVFLEDALVDIILNKKHTDNSQLSANGYNYFVFDSRVNTYEYVPLGYWEGQQEDNGFTFVKSEEDMSTGWSHDELHMDANKGFHISGKAGNKDASSAGIVLDAKPSSGNFTLSFTIRMDSTGDPSSNTDAEIAEILYIGSLTGDISNGGFYRAYRDGKGSWRRFKADQSDGSLLTNINGVFNMGATHKITLVFENGKVISYMDGSADNTEGSSFTFANKEDINIIFNGIKDSYNGAPLYIDDIYVFDTSLTSDEVSKLNSQGLSGLDTETKKLIGQYEFANGSSNHGSDNTGRDWLLNSVSRQSGAMASDTDKYASRIGGDGQIDLMGTQPLEIAKTANGDVLGVINPSSSSTNFRDAGWYYVKNLGTSVEQWNNYYMNEEVQTSKQLLGLPVGAEVSDNISLPEKHQAGLTGGGTGYTYTSTKDTPVRFYVDSDGYLRCFFWIGSKSSSSESIYFPSYVYELEDSEYIKVGALQRAFGAFVTKLSEASPTSEVSAVRFSSGAIPENDLDKLVLLDWTSDAGKSAGILSMNHNGSGTLDYTTGINGVKEYNYGLTGDTSTKMGLQSFIDNLEKYDDDEKTKYLIIFTDGKDTDLSKTYTNAHASEMPQWNKEEISEYMEAYRNAITKKDSDGKYELEALQLAEELKKDGYTIITVMLTGGPMAEGEKDYTDAQVLLTLMAGNSKTDDLDNDGADIDFDAKDEYFFSTDKAKDQRIKEIQKEHEEQGESITYEEAKAEFESQGIDTKELLTEIFTEEILREITRTLHGYTVTDYIDPRFDLVDTDGTVWHLNAGGKVVKGDGTAEGSQFTVDDGSDPTIPAVTITLSEKSDEEARNPYLRYNADNGMYYLEWVNQDIPGSIYGAESLAVWNAQVTIQAKDDFIGGNAVLTNGNAAEMNWVYHPNDAGGDASSGTDDMYKEGEELLGPGETEDPHPSKGFPRTTVNVQPYELTMEDAEQIIYLGESVSPKEILQTLLETVVGKETSSESSGEVDTYQYYWEYLLRYAWYTHQYSEGTWEERQDWTDELAEAELDRLLSELLTEKELTVPYSYMPDIYRDENQIVQAGSLTLHERDILGDIIYTWEEVKGIPDDASYNGTDYITTETSDKVYKLKVKFVPIALDEMSSASGNTVRKDANDKLVTEESGEEQDKQAVYEWNPDYKPAAGEEAETVYAEGTHTTYIVYGELAMEMKLLYRDLEYLVKKNNGTFTMSYELNVDRTPASADPYSLKVEFTITADDLSALKAEADNDGYVSIYSNPLYYYSGDETTLNAQVLPIGTYTVTLADMGGTADVPFEFNKIEVQATDKYDGHFSDEVLENPEVVVDESTGKIKFDDASTSNPLTEETKLIAESSSGSDGTSVSFYLGTNGISSDESVDPNARGEAPAYLNDRLGMVVLTALPLTGNLEIEKKVEDKFDTPDTTREFKFILEVKDGDTALDLSKYKCVKGADSVTIEEGTTSYEFVLKDGESLEIIGLPAGATYTVKEVKEDEYSSTAKITNGTAAGTVSSDSTYVTAADAIVDNDTETVTFTNAYVADGTLKLEIEKVLEGRPWKTSEEFTFILKPVNENAQGVLDADGVTVTVKAGDAEHKATLIGPTFTEVGEYTFTLSEVVPTETKGITYSSTIYNIKVVVTEDTSKNGNLVVTVLNENGDEQTLFTFTNTYSANGAWSPEVSKTLTGRKWETGESFTFTIAGGDTVTDSAIADGTVTLPNSGTLAITKGMDEADTYTGSFAPITFNNITFDNGNVTYTFKIAEDTSVPKPNVTFDTATYLVTVTLTDNGDGTLTANVTKVTKQENGAAEETVYEKTAGSTTGTLPEAFSFTNIYQEYISITVRKVWDDNDNEAGLRPGSITVHLKNGNDITQTDIGGPVIIKEEPNGWSYTWYDLPKYEKDGTLIPYYVTEDKVENYSTVYSSDLVYNEATGSYEITVTNTYPPKVNIQVTKIWDDQNDGAGRRPEELILHLYRSIAGGTAVEYTETAPTLSKHGSTWIYTYEDLPKRDENGNDYIYTVTEEPVEGYQSSGVSGSMEDGYTITNTYHETVNVEVELEWDDDSDGAKNRPDKVTVTVTGSDGSTYTQELEKNPDGTWPSAQFKDLPKYDEDGNEISYTADEEIGNGYGYTVSDPSYDPDRNCYTFTVTNSYHEMTKVTVTKVWNDGNDEAGARPDSITVQLKKDGVNVGDVVIIKPDDSGNWTWTSEEMKKYHDDGTPVVYTIEESAVSGYEAKYSDVVYNEETGYYEITVTNSYADDNQSANTGDSRHSLPWIVVVVVSGIGLLGASDTEEKKKRKKKAIRKVN